MEVYRIARAQYSKDLTGAGARLYGGRWNQKGIGIIYTSMTRSLAALECLVHVSLSVIPADLKIISLHIPDAVPVKHIGASSLPANWRDYPTPPALAELGTNWAKKNDTLLLQVPSSVIEKEFNILINPAHTDMKHVTIRKIEDFNFDDRLLRAKTK